MTASDKLTDALSSVDWGQNVAEFSADPIAVELMSDANMKLAIWSRQLEQVDRDNPALCFVREMQVAGHLVAVSTALAIYKSGAASTRTAVESALYYTYFRTHPSELATLVRDKKWYMSKTEIMEYHSTHTAAFKEMEKFLPVSSMLTPWYSEISAIIHGQVPGKWVQLKGVADIAPDASLRNEVIKGFSDGVEIINRLLLCTVGREFWDYFSGSAKKAILHGISGQVKQGLQLDVA